MQELFHGVACSAMHTCLAEELSARPSTADSAQQEVQLVEDSLQSSESQTSNSHTARWRIYTDMGVTFFPRSEPPIHIHMYPDSTPFELLVVWLRLCLLASLFLRVVLMRQRSILDELWKKLRKALEIEILMLHQAVIIWYGILIWVSSFTCYGWGPTLPCFGKKIALKLVIDFLAQLQYGSVEWGNQRPCLKEILAIYLRYESFKRAPSNHHFGCMAIPSVINLLILMHMLISRLSYTVWKESMLRQSLSF